MASDSCKDHNMPIVFFAEEGKRGLYEVDLTKIYDLELVSHQALRRGGGGKFLNGANNRCVKLLICLLYLEYSVLAVTF